MLIMNIDTKIVRGQKVLLKVILVFLKVIKAIKTAFICNLCFLCLLIFALNNYDESSVKS